MRITVTRDMNVKIALPPDYEQLQENEDFDCGDVIAHAYDMGYVYDDGIETVVEREILEHEHTSGVADARFVHLGEGSWTIVDPSDGTESVPVMKINTDEPEDGATIWAKANHDASYDHAPFDPENHVLCIACTQADSDGDQVFHPRSFVETEEVKATIDRIERLTSQLTTSDHVMVTVHGTPGGMAELLDPARHYRCEDCSEDDEPIYHRLGGVA